MAIQKLEMEELSIEQIEQVSGGDLVSAGFGTGLATSAAIGFGFFGPPGAIGAGLAFAGGFIGGSLFRRMFA
jgi:hypothetical protein